MAAAANYEQAITAVKAAIARIKQAMARFTDCETNKFASPDRVADARVEASSAIQEFAYQWPNVDLVIKEKGL